MKPVVRTVLVIAVSAALVSLYGCGTGGSSNVRPADPPVSEPAPAPLPTPIPAPMPPSPPRDPVSVAVIDASFRISHQDFTGIIERTVNLVGEDDTDMGPTNEDPQTNLMDHGTPVAALVGGHAFGQHNNVALTLKRVSDRDDGMVWSSTLTTGLIEAGNSGARVINVSYGGANAFLNNVMLMEAVRPGEDYQGAVITVAAGNAGVALDPYWDLQRFINKGTETVWDQTLIVGGGTSSGDNRHSSSNYPGASEWIQDRFLMAPFQVTSASHWSDTGVGTFWGTSFAAPQVAGIAAAIIDVWPHLDALEVSQLLLDTARRDHALYASNTCGDSGDVNCGLYYMGQGVVDRTQAMSPQGALVMPLGDQVGGESQALDQSLARWSPSFGGLDTSALAGVAVFDDLGRNYALDLGALNQGIEAHGTRVQQRMTALANSAYGPQRQNHDLAPGVGFAAYTGPTGAIQSHRMQLQAGAYQIGAYAFSGGDTRLTDPWVAPLGGVRQLTDASSGLNAGLHSGFGLDLAVPLGSVLSLHTAHWQASGEIGSFSAGNEHAQSRFDAALGWQAHDRLHLMAGLGRRDEARRVLGSTGHGVFDMSSGLTMHQQVVGANWSLNPNLDLIARYEAGQGSSIGGNGIFGAIRSLQTEQYQVGLRATHQEHQAAFTLTRPLRVTGGTLQMDVPVGRELDGRVIREDRSIELQAAGSQMDIELGYGYTPSAHSRIQANLLYTHEPDHQKNASPAVFASIVYTLAF